MRGTPGGKAYQVTTNAIFCFGSIQMSIVKDADKTRFFTIELQSQKGSNWLEVDQKIKLINHLGPSLFRYMWENVHVVFERIKQVNQILSSWELEQRLKDQIAAVLGPYMALTPGEKVSRKYLENAISKMNLQQNYILDNTGESESDLIYGAILAMPLATDRSRTVWGAIEQIKKGGWKEYNAHLQASGIYFDAKENTIAVYCQNGYLTAQMANIGFTDIKNLLKRCYNFQKAGHQCMILGKNVRCILLKLGV